MQIKKVVKRLIALGAGATMLGATVMGAMAADLSSFPGSFHDDGVFNGYFVVGEAAKPIDNLAMTDIATSMWYASSAGGTTVSVAGDAWKVATSAKDLEMANNNATAGTIAGEQIYDINTYITKDELGALADGTYKTGESEFSFSQYLYFDTKDSVTNEIVKYAESDDDVTDVFFFVESGKNIGKYKLEFSSSAESDIHNTAGTAATGGEVLQDFEDTKINLLGQEFSIVLARRPQSTPQNSIKLTMMGGAVTGALLEGETQTYEINGGTYEVSLTYVDETYVKFTVNGESTDKLQAGETYKLADGKEVGISEILYQSYAGGIHSADFFLGAQKVVLQDNDITNTVSDKEMEVGGETIDGADVIITGTDDNTTFRLTTLEINMTAQDDYFVPADGKLSEEIAAAGDDEEILFTNNWDIEFKGLSAADSHAIKLDSSTDRKYKLIWYDGDGNKVSMPMFYATNSENISFSEEAGEKCVSLREDTELRKNDYFVLSAGDPSDGSGVSFALQYKGADKSDSTSPKIKFKNLGSGESLEYSVNTATDDYICRIKLGGHTFYVENSTASTGKDFYLKIDQSGDDATPDPADIDIVDSYGAKLVFGSINATGRCEDQIGSNTITITAPNSNDYDNLAPSSIVVTADATTTNEVTISAFTIDTVDNPLLTPEGEENIAYGYTTMGGMMTYESPSSAPNKFTYDYPAVQKLPQLFVTSGATTTSVSGGAGQALVQVVDATKLDTEVADSSAQNLIVVGGPCVNSVAAELLGNPADCAEGFSTGKARLKMLDTGAGKLAMLVAGYGGEDTRLAGKVVAHRASELSGEEMEVAGTTWSDATLGVPTVVESVE